MKTSQPEKPDSLKSTLIAVAKIGIMLLGIVGLAVEIFRDNGLLKQLFTKMLDSPLGIFSIPLALLALYLFNRWLGTATDGKASTRGDLPMYIMMGIGAYFLYRLMTTGSL